jgi:SAM-dependent methyltransferase
MEEAMSVRVVPYALDNGRPTAPAVLDYLAEILDEFTRSRLKLARVPAGGRCLEIGAGNGSIAAWLARRVGPSGEVIATDIKPQHIRPHPRVEVREHNIATDDLPPGYFDVIHARLVLAHLPSRCELVEKLIAGLTPGGVLVIEDWGRLTGMVLFSPVPDADGIYRRYQETLLRVLASAGTDTSWAEHMAGVMSGHGLADIDTVVNAASWRRATAGCLLPTVVARELRPKLIEVGATSKDLDALVEVMTHPDTLIVGNLTFSTIGRRTQA